MPIMSYTDPDTARAIDNERLAQFKTATLILEHQLTETAAVRNHNCAMREIDLKHAAIDLKTADIELSNFRLESLYTHDREITELQILKNQAGGRGPLDRALPYVTLIVCGLVAIEIVTKTLIQVVTQ